MPATPFVRVWSRWPVRVSSRSHLQPALAISLALHAVALHQFPYLSAVTGHDAPDATLTVQLLPAPATLTVVSSDRAPIPALAMLPVEEGETGAPHREYAVENREGSPDAMPSQPASREQSPAPLVIPPTYYGMRDVDVFPRPIEPLPMLRAEPGDPAANHKALRVEVFIDERGVVTDVQLRETRVSAQLRRATTEMFFATRFQPARKSGHAVASRIEIELLYGGMQLTAN